MMQVSVKAFRGCTTSNASPLLFAQANLPHGAAPSDRRRLHLRFALRTFYSFDAGNPRVGSSSTFPATRVEFQGRRVEAVDDNSQVLMSFASLCERPQQSPREGEEMQAPSPPYVDVSIKAWA